MDKELNKQHRIRQVPSFGQLNGRAVNEIARISDIVAVPSGHAFFKEGCTGYELCIILEGRARVERRGTTINRLSKNDLWGELSLVDRGPHIGTIIAETDMLILVVESCYFEYLLELAPTLWKTTSLTLSGYVRGLCEALDEKEAADLTRSLPPALYGFEPVQPLHAA